MLEFLPCTVPHYMAEILTIFGSYFGRNNDFINSFWNLLAFSTEFSTYLFFCSLHVTCFCFHVHSFLIQFEEVYFISWDEHSYFIRLEVEHSFHVYCVHARLSSKSIPYKLVHNRMKYFFQNTNEKGIRKMDRLCLWMAP